MLSTCCSCPASVFSLLKTNSRSQRKYPWSTNLFYMPVSWRSISCRFEPNFWTLFGTMTQSVGLVLGQNWGCVCWANWWLDCIFLSKSIIFHLDSINIHLYSIYIPFIFHFYSFYIPFNSIYIPLISSLNFICILFILHLCSDLYFIYIPFMFKFIFHLHPYTMTNLGFIFCCKALVSFGGFCHGDACLH